MLLSRATNRLNRPVTTIAVHLHAHDVVRLHAVCEPRRRVRLGSQQQRYERREVRVSVESVAVGQRGRQLAWQRVLRRWHSSSLHGCGRQVAVAVR